MVKVGLILAILAMIVLICYIVIHDEGERNSPAVVVSRMTIGDYEQVIYKAGGYIDMSVIIGEEKKVPISVQRLYTKNTRINEFLVIYKKE